MVGTSEGIGADELGDVYCAFTPIWNTATSLLVKNMNFTKYYELLIQIIFLPPGG